jgi:quercetin 2,3-dioxygenase
VTSRLAIPSSTVAEWRPYERAGEVIATVARQFPAHAHEAQEVLTYVVDGFASYQLDGEPLDPLSAGAVRLLTSPARATHRISPARGGPIRWFNLVVGLPHGGEGAPRLQASMPTPTRGAEGAVFKSLVGSGSGIASTSGLESKAIEFIEPGTTFLRIGHERRGLVYAISGSGTVDGHGFDGGEAVLVEHAAGIALEGRPGLRVILSTVPRRP